MWRRGTSEAGGQCTLCSSAVSMDSVESSRFEEASLYGNVNNEKQTEQGREENQSTCLTSRRLRR